MSDRYDICAPRPGKDGKTFWLRIGAMFRAREGDGYSIKLDALPLPNEKGEIWIKAFVPRDRDESRREDRRPQNVRDAANRYADGLGDERRSLRDDLGEDIPF